MDRASHMDDAGLGSLLYGSLMGCSCSVLHATVILHHETAAEAAIACAARGPRAAAGPMLAAGPLQFSGEGNAEAVI